MVSKQPTQVAKEPAWTIGDYGPYSKASNSTSFQKFNQTFTCLVSIGTI